MNHNYAPQRKLALASQQGLPAQETGIIPRPRAAEQGRHAALSVPDPVRALGEPLQPFFDACGGRQRISVVVRRRGSDNPPETHVFQQPFLLIGRCPENDLSLLHSSVGFRHLYLQLRDGRWYFVNLARLSNVVSATREAATGWFDPGDALTIGPYTVTHVTDASLSQLRPMPPALEEAGPLPPIELDMVNSRSGSRGLRTRKIVQAITLIGGSRKCDLCLRDDTISRIHAALVLTHQGLWVVDLLGRNGVLVDDCPVYWKQIREGSILQVGRFRFRMRLGTLPALTGPRAAVAPSPEMTLTVPAAHSPSTAPAAVPLGGLSEQGVMEMFRQMAEMQNQFFQHSQMQMQLMAQMLAHLERTQQESVRKDLARIDDITRELESLRLALANPAAVPTAIPGEPAPSVADLSRRTPAAISPAPTATSAASEPSSDDDFPTFEDVVPISPLGTERPSRFSTSEPARSFGVREPAAGTASARSPDHPHQDPHVAPPSEAELAESRMRLTRRMAKLAGERTTIWNRVQGVFKRRPEDAEGR
ncbi:MAG: FHA domain-containing protein [Planctomycetales bacterium]